MHLPPTLVRQFETGATRSPEEGKYDYEGFLSPSVLERYAAYMHKHRTQSDGGLRDSDNWQKGIPQSSYMKSMWRHFFDVWKNHRGLRTPESEEDNLCAMMFNVQGKLHEILKAKAEHVTTTSEFKDIWVNPDFQIGGTD